MRRWQQGLHSVRHISVHRQYSILTTAPCQHIKIPRPGGVTVSISVYEPLIASRDAAPRAVLYFPRGPFLQKEEVDEQVISTLRSTLPHPIVVNHPESYQHPHAIYDSTAAYDWTVENILSAGKWTGRPGGIATCGELVGGTLATALALTECRPGQAKVIAAAINNPILDWADLEPRKRKRASTITMDMLEEERNNLFKKPEHYYDCFASPILFFRSAASLPQSMDEDLYTPLGEPVTRPRSSRMFPSTAHNTVLPAFRISSGTTILSSQAAEFAQQYAASLLRQRRARSRRSRRRIDDFYDHDPIELSFDDLLAQDAAYVDSKLESVSYNDSGLWDEPLTGKTMVHNMAIWLREKLSG